MHHGVAETFGSVCATSRRYIWRVELRSRGATAVDHGEAQKHHVTDAAALDPHDKLPASIRRTQNAIRTVLVRQPVPATNRHQGIIALAGKLAHCCGAATVEKGPLWRATSVPPLMSFPDWSGQRCLTGVWTSQASLVEYTGFASNELLGAGWQSAIHPEDLPHLLRRWRSILSAGQVSTMEARLRRFDGRLSLVHFPSSAIGRRIRKNRQMVGLNIDIEDR